MQYIQRLQRLRYSIFPPFLLWLYLTTVLSGCGVAPCEAVPPPYREPGLIVANGLVYMEVWQLHTLFVRRGSDGAQVWHYTSNSVTVDPILLGVENGVVYLRDGDDLLGLRASDGRQLWKKSNITQDVTEINGTVYFYQSSNQVLIALNGSDGSQRWTTRIPEIKYVPLVLQVANGIAFVLSSQNEVSALSVDTGQIVWQNSSAVQTSTPFPPSSLYIVSGIIYIYTQAPQAIPPYEKQIYALRASDGKFLWSSPQNNVGDRLVFDPATGTVFTLENSDTPGTTLDALRGRNGSILWHIPTGARYLVWLNNKLYAAAGGREGALGPWLLGPVDILRPSDGKKLWDYAPPDDSFNFSITAAGSTTYVLADQSSAGLYNATLEALRATDGTVLWKHSSLESAGFLLADGALYTAIAGNDGNDCVSANSTYLEKFRPETGDQLWKQKLS